MNKKGFTLIETIITIAIVGIILTIATVFYTNIAKNKKDQLSKAEIKLIETAAVKYGEEHNKEVKDGNIYIKYNVYSKKIQKENIIDSEIIATYTTTKISVLALVKLGYLGSDYKNIDGDTYLYLQNNKIYAKYDEKIYNFNYEYNKEKKQIEVNIDDHLQGKYDLYIDDFKIKEDIEFNGDFIIDNIEISNTNIITIKININNIIISKSKKIDLELRCPIIKSDIKPNTWTNNEITFTVNFKNSNVSYYTLLSAKKNNDKYKWYLWPTDKAIDQSDASAKIFDTELLNEIDNNEITEEYIRTQFKEIKKYVLKVSGYRKFNVRVFDENGKFLDCGYKRIYLIK